VFNESPVVTEPELKSFTVADEFNKEQTNKVLADNNLVLMKGLFPGVGKTTVIKSYGKEKTLFACPYNTLAQDLRKDGCNAVTVSKLLSLYGDGQNYTNNKGFDVTPYDTICFDEIFLLNPRELERAKKFVLKHPEIKFFATGDTNQLPPISMNYNNIESNTSYLSTCVNNIFPNQLVLSVNKRLKCEKEKQTLYKLKDEILNNMDTPIMDIFRKHGIKIEKDKRKVRTVRNVAYFNERVDEINKLIHNYNKETGESRKIGGIEWFVGMTVICRVQLKFPKNKRMFTNYTYTITSLNGGMQLKDELDGDEFLLADNLVNKHVKLPYVNTCHSV